MLECCRCDPRPPEARVASDPSDSQGEEKSSKAPPPVPAHVSRRSEARQDTNGGSVDDSLDGDTVVVHEDVPPERSVKATKSTASRHETMMERAHSFLGIDEPLDPERRQIQLGPTLHLSHKWKATVATLAEVDPEEKAPTTGRVPRGTTRERPSGNGNSPADYVWLEDALSRLRRCQADSLNAKDNQSSAKFMPIFFAIGACPNALCGKQAVMYSASEKGVVDFWWVKPSKENSAVLEDQTLRLHQTGPHKNSPGRSRQFYQPFADAIVEGRIIRGWRFGLAQVPCADGRDVPRAYIAQQADDSTGDRLYLLFLWMEDWTTNPFASCKYVKGKMCIRSLRPPQSFTSGSARFGTTRSASQTSRTTSRSPPRCRRPRSRDSGR
jgi:hypothetical protein